MQFQTKWLDVSYDVRFRRPSFVFVTSQASLLKALYDAISPRFSIGPGDMSIEASQKIRESKTTVTLFNGNATIELTADGFHALFNNPIGPDDIAIVTDTLKLATDAYTSVLTDVEPQSSSINLKAFLEVKGDSPDAWKYLRDTFGPKSPFSTFDVPSVSDLVPGASIDVISTEQRWVFHFDLTRAIRSRTELFVTANMHYEDGSTIHGLDAKAKHFASCIEAALKQADLEAVVSK